MHNSSDDDDFVPSSSPIFPSTIRLPTQRKAAMREDKAVQRYGLFFKVSSYLLKCDDSNFAFGGALDSQTTDTQYFDHLVDNVQSDPPSPTLFSPTHVNSKYIYRL